ncbi:growth hormone secretagogue receptor type 1-like [Patiria miniata]|uniref:G-protein coupled receptors family 1 profile domain-containing protein n=1 Tax=Patiria miniata TaxID=46514 RepID=A0A914AZ46_PATMI|nr:growth hormone secretagogue receptor type 1-like [Patiria miniata]
MAGSALNESGICEEFDGLLDFNDEATRKRFFQTASEFFLVRIGFPIVWLVGLPANLAFLYTIYKVRHMRSITNFYLANLALADIFCLVLYPGLYSWSYYATPVVFNFQTSSWLECAAIFFSFDIPNFASNAIVTLVALERFYAICRPLQSRQASSHGRAAVLLVVFWAVSVALALSVCSRFITVRVYCVLWPDSDNGQYDSLPDTVSFCTAGEPWVAVYAHCLYVVIWFLGLIVNSFLYYKIVRRLGRRTVGRSASNTDAKSRLVRNQVARMLMVNSIVFFVLQAPRVLTLNLLSFLSAATGQVLQPSDVPFLVPVTYFLSLLNSAVNPIIYSGTNIRYREAFLQAFGCTCRRGREGTGGSSLGDMSVSSKVTERSKCEQSEDNLDDIPNSSI